MNNKKVGRPAGSKSTTNFNLGMLYQRFGPNCCPPISTVWLREQGLISDVKFDSSIPLSIPEVEKKVSSVKIIDFSQEMD